MRRLTGIRDAREVFKLAKKYGKTGPCAEPLVNVYLDRSEYDLQARLPGSLLEKRKLRTEHQGLAYTIDVHQGPNAGLVLVESEAEAAYLVPPPCAGEEVTGDARYFNSNLVKRPFKDW